ncbi:hypothetical protein AWB68_04955 [Caballeronia choica]|jgi:hypothetical protein|uniref:Uncharacterized protein n=1 Tax=Caballeronia choica TaxID=326476 RepID=A0A158K766_9BURK|nr:hypothetical protein AWB68_04955 [Caballeronia choica]
MRSLRRFRAIARRCGKHSLDRCPFQPFDGLVQRQVWQSIVQRDGLRQSRRRGIEESEVVFRHERTARERPQSLHRVLQFAGVTGPRVTQKPPFGAGTERGCCASHQHRPREKMPRERSKLRSRSPSSILEGLLSFKVDSSGWTRKTSSAASVEPLENESGASSSSTMQMRASRSAIHRWTLFGERPHALLLIAGIEEKLETPCASDGSMSKPASATSETRPWRKPSRHRPARRSGPFIGRYFPLVRSRRIAFHPHQA